MLPDAMTFNTVIDAYGRAGKTEKMEETYNAMLAAGLPHTPLPSPNPVHRPS